MPKAKPSRARVAKKPPRARAAKKAPARAVSRSAKPGKKRGGPAPESVVIRASVSHFPTGFIPTAHLIQREHPHRVFDLRERRGMGAKYVHLAAADEDPSVLAIAVAQKALERAGLDADDLDLLVSASCTPPDYDMWSLPAKVAEQIGARRAECLGVGDAGCASAFAALRLLLPVLRDPDGPRRALLFNASITPGSHFIPPYTIFGDGAGAIVLERTRERTAGARVVRADFRSHPQFIEAFRCNAGLRQLRKQGKLEPVDWTVNPLDTDLVRGLAEEGLDLCLNGMRDSLAKAGWTIDQLRWLITDNVATSSTEEIAAGLGVPEDRTLYENCSRYGHAWVVDLFANLETVLHERDPQPGDRIACTGAGLGEHFGVLLLEV
ncbi:MAG: hypothetical protein IT384_34075 [Deltaproteobacteria bacterium]|nr:hypothetical protein [Deltaproteobacteria bacterium]